MRTPRLTSWLSIGLLIGLFSANTALAQEEQEQEGGANLAQQARNPTASLTLFQIVTSHTASYHNFDDANLTSIILMPVIPFKTGKLRHIVRITLPWVASSPDWATLRGEDPGNILPPSYVPTADVSGLGDTNVFDLLIFPAPWKGGRIAAGVSATVPTATDPALGTEKWSVGPALGGLVQAGKFLAGGIVLTNFSFAGASDRDDVSLMTLQPFASYGLGNNWSAELPMMMFNYDFNADKWTSLPLGARIGKMVTIGKLPVRFFGDAEYNFADTGVSPQWTFRFAVVPLL